MVEEQECETVSEMHEELCYHGLSDQGSKEDLMKRLYKVHEERWSAEGRKADYERRLDVYAKKRLDDIVPFVWFNELPKDIRLMIVSICFPAIMGDCE